MCTKLLKTIPLDSPPEYAAGEDFSGIKGQANFDSTSWSPTRLSSDGSSFFAISSRSDGGVHFKIFGYKSRFGLGIDFDEIYSLMEILRLRWFLIPLWISDEPRSMLSDVYPSLSLLQSNYFSKTITKWLPSGELVTGWGSWIFMWKVSESDCYPIGCFEVPRSDPVKNPIDTLSVHNHGFSVTSVRGTSETQWAFTIIDDQIETVIVKSHPVTVSKNLHQIVGGKEGIASNSIKGGIALSATYSVNMIELYIARRTSKSIQIVRQFNQPSYTMENLIDLLLNKAINSDNHLMDILIAMISVYRNDSGRRLAVMDERDVFRTMVNRFTGSEGYTSANGPVEKRLALGLHHAHSQLDYLAASSAKARMNERRTILEQIVGHHIPHTVACAACSDLSARVEYSSYRFYSICSDNHRQVLCQLTFVPLGVGTVVECCWCKSVYTTDRGISLCSLCRIGLTQRI
jgi:hypothetical protein